MSTAALHRIDRAPDAARLRDLRPLVEDLHSDYADVLDRGDIEAWPQFFTPDGIYKLIARDNADANLPLSLISCDGMGMLKDRAYAIKNTEMFAPRYQTHHISQIRLLECTDDGLIRARANYLILETLIDEQTRILQSGRYVDTFQYDGTALLIKERRCIYDTVLVPICVVYPP
jgi:anthranilate 1,2-dioxygenase small subunit